MTALSVEAPHAASATPEPDALACDDDPLQPSIARVTATHGCSPSRALDLSRSRTHDAVLDILHAYKLSGNFHRNLDTVLKDMGVFGMVTYRVAPNHALVAFPDCRHVVFTGREHVSIAVFDDVVASIKTRIGFEPPWWGRLLAGRRNAPVHRIPRHY